VENGALTIASFTPSIQAADTAAATDTMPPTSTIRSISKPVPNPRGGDTSERVRGSQGY